MSVGPWGAYWSCICDNRLIYKLGNGTDPFASMESCPNICPGCGSVKRNYEVRIARKVYKSRPFPGLPPGFTYEFRKDEDAEA